MFAKHFLSFFMMENVSILRWKDQKEEFSQLLKDLTLTGQFTDVTFVLDDQSQISSHKVILAAVSPLFQEILSD